MADAEALIGSWRMRSWTRQAVATGVSEDVLGPDPIGYVAYHADGLMMATAFRRERPVTSDPLTARDKIALYDGMLAYVAGWVLKGNTVVHHVEAAWDPRWQVALSRPFRLEGRRLKIHDAPGRDPETGEAVLYRVCFDKV